jgi:RHS repeat-associated protein
VLGHSQFAAPLRRAAPRFHMLQRPNHLHFAMLPLRYASPLHKCENHIHFCAEFGEQVSSTRFASTPSRTMYFDTAYAPFGEPYASSGTADLSFTGQRQDTVAGLYDFPAREYSIQGRWPSPDPAGLAAVDPSNPQSWNRYAYVMNNPLAFTDPDGLDPCQGANNFAFSQAANGTGIFTQDDCTANGGTWAGSGAPPDMGPSNPMLTGDCPAQYMSCTTGSNGSVLAMTGSSSGYLFYKAPYEDSASGMGYFWAPITIGLSASVGNSTSGNSGSSSGSAVTMSADPNGKKNYCSHQADLAALEDLLPGITRGQYVSTAAKISLETGSHLALEGAAASSIFKRAIRTRTGIAMSTAEKLFERAAILLLLVSGGEALRAAQNEYQGCMNF